MMTGNLSTAVTAHKPTRADIEKRMGELLTQAGLHFQNLTSAASPDSPPTRALPPPEPLPAPPQPPAGLQPGETGLHGLPVNRAPYQPEPQPEPPPPLGACPERSELWNDYYATLSQDRPGSHGTATGRAEAQVLRLSALNAALDCSPIIRLPHFHAALALWDYCSYSAASLFGTCVGDSIADRILEALQAAENGLTREQIRKLFHGHVSSGLIDQALERLSSLQLVTSRYVSGRGPGRRTVLWSAIDHDQQELMEEETAESGDLAELVRLVRTF